MRREPRAGSPLASGPVPSYRSLVFHRGSACMADQKKRPKPAESEEEVVLLKDLAPREEVKGGAKLRFGEPPSPQSKSRRRG
jgi:hypothetical protein